MRLDKNSQDGVSELSVPGTQLDRQSHIHHVVTGVEERHTMLAGGSEQIYNPHHMMTEPSNETHHTRFCKLVRSLHRSYKSESLVIQRRTYIMNFAISRLLSGKKFLELTKPYSNIDMGQCKNYKILIKRQE